MMRKCFSIKSQTTSIIVINCQMHSTKNENIGETILQNRDFYRIKLNLP